MLIHTKGIVLHTIPYSETSIIAKIFTEELGLQSYIIKGARKAKSKTKAGLFQPLSLLDMVVYHKETKQLNFIKEIKIDQAYQSLHTDIRKSTVLLFISELLAKSIKEEEQNKELYRYIHDSLISFDKTDQLIPFFHILFSSLLTKHLGFFPQSNHSPQTPFLDPMEGTFRAVQTHPRLNKENSQLFFNAFTRPESMLPSFNKKERSELINLIILYYQAHIPSFKEIISLDILKTVFA